MEIKKTTKTQTYEVTITRYIAYDGKEFITEEACKRYEANLKFEKLNIETCHEAQNIPNISCEYSFIDSYDYIWYRPKSVEEIDALNEKYTLEIPTSYVGEWICVETNVNFGCDLSDSYYSTISDGIDYAKRLFDILGYELIVKKKEEN